MKSIRCAARRIPTKETMRRLLGTLALFTLGATSLLAQGTQLSGVVRDEDGAALVGARITLVDESNGTQVEATSDDRGRYTLQAPPGSYRLIAKASGFKDVGFANVEVPTTSPAVLQILFDRSAIKEARNFRYMFYGFGAAWTLVVIYVVMLALRERRLRRELDRVRQMVESAPKKL